MKYLNTLLLISLVVFFSACKKNSQDYFILGNKSYSDSNFALARNQLKMLDSNHSDYAKAIKILHQIDSIEKVILSQQELKDSVQQVEKLNILKEYAGNYMVSVSGTNAIESVEVYKLKDNGKAEWLWIVRPYGAYEVKQKQQGNWSVNDSSISITIKGVEEVFINNDGIFSGKTLKKRSLVKTPKAFL